MRIVNEPRAPRVIYVCDECASDRVYVDCEHYSDDELRWVSSVTRRVDDCGRNYGDLKPGWYCQDCLESVSFEHREHIGMTLLEWLAA